MRRVIVIGALALILLCGAATAVAMASLSPRAPLIYTLPVFPGARYVSYSAPGLQSLPASSMIAPSASSLATLGFETGATPQAVLDYYDAWLMARGWASQRYSQAQTQGAWQFAAYVKDGSPELARMHLRGFNGMEPLVDIPSDHTRLYINAHPLRDTTLVEILVYSIEY